MKSLAEDPAFKHWFDSSKVSTVNGQPLIDVAHVLDYVRVVHPDQDDFTREDAVIEPNIKRFKSYKLERLPISEINLSRYHVHEELVDEYSRKDTPYPPIVYDPNRKAVIDGMHRSNAAHRRGDDSIIALVGKHRCEAEEGEVDAHFSQDRPRA
jgi:hypothetical protein